MSTTTSEQSQSPIEDAEKARLAAAAERAGALDAADPERVRDDPGSFVADLAAMDDRELARRISSEATDQLIERYSVGLELVETNLAGLDLSDLDLRRAKLNRANLASCNLARADLTGSSIVCPVMERTNLRETRLSNFYAHALSIVSSDASGADLSGSVDCTGSLFHGVQFVGSDLRGANFSGSTFYQCDLTDADLGGASLVGAVFNECILRGTRFTAAKLDDATITRSQADGIVLEGAQGGGLVIQTMTGFTGASLRGAHLPGLRFRGSTAVEADFSHAYLARFDALDCALSRCSFASSTLSASRFVSVSGESTSFERADLSEAKLSACSLPNARFDGAKAENAELLRCSLPDSSFGPSAENGGGPEVFSGRSFAARDCDLSNADFSHAYLYRAFFTGDPVTGMVLDGSDFGEANLIQAYVAASMRAANLRGAYGAYARLNQTDLTGADLTGMSLYQASLVKTRLADAKLTGVAPPLFLDRCPGLDSAELDPELREACEGRSTRAPKGQRGST